MKAWLVRVVLGTTLIVCGEASLATAQQSERLTRPFASHMQADGKLAMPANATLGNLVVDQYINIGAKLAAAGDDRDALARAYSASMCASSGIGSVVASSAAKAVNAMRREDRTGLRSRDPASLSALSTVVLADLDGVTAEAIRTDEAKGPGAYHYGIYALDLAWSVCGFFGLEGSL